MAEDFALRHNEYLGYVHENTRNISRSVMWSGISPDFLAKTVDGQLVFDTFRKKKYFVDFVKDPGISSLDRLKYKFSKFAKALINKINFRLMDKDLQWRMVFNELGYYDVKTKYSFQDHPLFGLDKCVHGVVVCLQWHNYCLLYPLIKDIKNLKYFEIGAGSGILSMFLRHDLGAKNVIVDLPEMISYSSACVNQVFPEAKILLPNEIDGEVNYDDYDYVFLLPNQTDYLPGDYFDLAVNCMSMCEMRREEIDFYFKVIQRVVKDGGHFFCSNRLRKNPDNIPTTDSVTPLAPEVPNTNHFFKYPWDRKNIDVLIDIHHFRFNWLKESPLVIDRIQKISK